MGDEFHRTCPESLVGYRLFFPIARLCIERPDFLPRVLRLSGLPMLYIKSLTLVKILCVTASLRSVC